MNTRLVMERIVRVMRVVLAQAVSLLMILNAATTLPLTHAILVF